MTDSAGRRRWPLAVALALAAVHMLVFDRGLGGDGWASFAALESVVDDGDLWLENNLRGVSNGIVRGASGHLVMQYPPGIVALDLPPFLAARALDAALPAGWLARGADLPPVGRVPRRVFLEAAAIVLARNLAALLGMAWIAFALRRLGWGERTAAAAAFLAFFGGPLVFYSLVGMTHAPAFALAALTAWLLVRQRESASLALALAVGATIGFATLVRYGAVAWLPTALLAVRGGALRRWTLLAGFAAFLPVLPLTWHAAAGSWGPPGYGGQMAITLASPWNVLFSPRHGLFLFHPALLLAAAGLLAMVWRRTDRKIGMIALVWFLAIATLNGWWSEWANEGGYGQRFLTDALPALALGFAAVLAAVGGLGPRRWRSLALGGIAAATAAGYLLFFAAVAGLAPGPAPLPWPQRLADYRPLVEHPPGPREIAAGLRRASFLVRALSPP
ncbi:MAG TPA: hypothetical protein VIH93_13790 [Thermoanaerobaculia bacterium]